MCGPDTEIPLVMTDHLRFLTKTVWLPILVSPIVAIIIHIR